MATTGNPVNGPTKTYVCDSAIQQGAAVVLTGTAPGRIAQAAGANAQGIGIADTPGVAGQAIRITRLGDTPALAGGVIAAGQYVKTDATGRLAPVTGTAGGGENIVGRAESPAYAAGDTFVVFVLPSVL